MFLLAATDRATDRAGRTPRIARDEATSNEEQRDSCALRKMAGKSGRSQTRKRVAKGKKIWLKYDKPNTEAGKKNR
jgi:hypothetical protein